MNKVLQQWRENVYLHEESISCYGIVISRRMTVIRLNDGRLWVHSPNALTSGLEQALDSIGEVAFIVAPNKMHQSALDEYVERYPTAKLFLPSAFPEMRPDLPYHDILGNVPPSGWGSEIEQVVLRGNVFFTEVVFFHHASQAIIVTDLIENFRKEHTSALGRVLLRLAKGYGRPVPAPEHRAYTLSWKQFSESVAPMNGWDFDAIILAHGALIEEKARDCLQSVVDQVIAISKGRWKPTRWLLGVLSRFQCMPYLLRSPRPARAEPCAAGHRHRACQSDDP